MAEKLTSITDYYDIFNIEVFDKIFILMISNLFLHSNIFLQFE